MKGWIRHLDFFVVDMVSMLAAYGLSTLIMGHPEYKETLILGNMCVTLLIIQFVASFMMDAYNGIVMRGYLKELYACLKQAAVVFAALVIILYSAKSGNLHLREEAFSIMLIDVFTLYIGRIIWKLYLKKRYEQLKYTRQIFVIAIQEKARELVEHMSDNKIRGYQISGLCIMDKDMKGQRIGDIRVDTNRAELEAYIENCIVDEVFLSLPGESKLEHDLARKFLDLGIKVHIYMEQTYEDFPNREWGIIFNHNVLTSSISRITFREILIKRSIDILGGITGLILTVVIGAFVAPAIFLKSPGPVLFSQIRVGQNGRRFKIYKFRSMYIDAEERKKELMLQNEGSDLMFKIKNDPRIISGVGNFIRKTSIDELPQFWNILKGDMSLVGTRPPTEEEYEQYEWHHKKRLGMKPGLTGLWQISGRSEIKDFEQVVKLDTAYIEHYSLELDVKIILKTILIVFRGEGAS